MAIPIISALMPLLQPIVEKVTGKDDAERVMAELQQQAVAQKIEAELKQHIIDNLASVDKAQIHLNTIQARDASFFVKGARPFAMWVMVVGWSYQSMGAPLLSQIAAFYGIDIPIPTLEDNVTDGLLYGLFGLSAMRGVEKITGRDVLKSKKG